MRPGGGSEGAALPRHVAIIMDGNGRWARQRGLPRVEGHRMGANAVREVVECARELGIRYLTLYAFSQENWGRPEPEVRALMALLQEFLVSELPLMRKHGIRLHVIGDPAAMPFVVRQVLAATMDATAKNSDMTLTLGLSYAGRNEIVRAARGIAAEAANGKLAPEEVTEEFFSGRLDTAGMPDPDLVIRTSGEIRISNFLLWQSAYAEFVFTDVLWPDFGKADLLRALEEYSRRNRRFGLTDDQAGPPSAK
ncbi:MAG: pyrophosphate synthase [Deltaproteobacteria bacterium]|nr:pyrophosphate synthase [Deltaproteobacteria bacterium]